MRKSEAHAAAISKGRKQQGQEAAVGEAAAVSLGMTDVKRGVLYAGVRQCVGEQESSWIKARHESLVHGIMRHA